MSRVRLVWLLSVAVTAAGLQPWARAAEDAYPARPVRLVVPFAPGGSSDALARTLAQKFPETFGQQLVADNRSGANGNLGMEILARATPDGYTIGVGYIASLAINPALYRTLPFDPLRDYAPVTQLTMSPNILALHASVPATSIRELVAMAKARQGGLNYASGGVGTIGHLATELFKSVAGIEAQHIVYKGSGQAVVDLLGGQVQMMMSGMAAVLPHARTGKLRAIGVTSRERSPAAPDVPTIAESGYPGFEAIGWFGILAPAGTPPARVERLASGIAGIYHAADTKARLNATGFDVVTSRPAEFAAYIRSEHAKWGRAVRAANIRAE